VTISLQHAWRQQVESFMQPLRKNRLILQKRRRLYRLRARGAAATEYLLILTLVVIPLALLLPMFVRMIHLYALRVGGGLHLPFP
jgi:hypothetical protein